ncbi:QueT transporter family protein [Amygdalobacter nucleatus]|uniref:QueT transporter family protein n=1 Tax=Amygdalobacter nucleatus TaxID=3029274 RepID=UPI0027A30883|nr:QueT transporter family protein [Amygdalobacter nucleatus]WEG36683.1 QueT transporter family protein [Amygdalobacter nucleatus]
MMHEEAAASNLAATRSRLSISVVAIAAVVAALYAVVTLLSAPIAFGVFQFRLSEAMMLLIALGVVNPHNALFKSSVQAVRPNRLGLAIAFGVTIGCFIANYFNPGNLGPIDYFGGTFATGVAAWLTYKLALNNKALNLYRSKQIKLSQIWQYLSFYVLPLPSVLLNGAIVGVYLPFLFTPADEMSLYVILSNVVIFSICEAVVVYVLGLLLLTLFLPQESKWWRV